MQAEAVTHAGRRVPWLLLAFLGNAAQLLGRAAHRCLTADIRTLGTTIQDDSFYFLLPAFRFWHDGRFAFDGEHPSYVGQPLYCVFQTLLAAPFADRASFLRAAILSGYVLWVVTAALLGWLVLRLARPAGQAAVWAAALAAHGYLLNIPGLFGHTTAKENSLFALLLVLSLLATLWARERPSARRTALVGLLVATAVSARVTPSTLGVAALLAIASCAGRVQRLVWCAAGAAVVVTPWCWYTLSHFGRILPTSGGVKTQMFLDQVRLHGLSGVLAEQAWRVLPFLTDALAYAAGLPSGFHVPQVFVDGPPRPGVLSIALLACLAGLVLLASRRHLLRQSGSAWLLPGATLVAIAGTVVTPLVLGPWLSTTHATYLQWYVSDLPVLVPATLALAWPLVPRGADLLARGQLLGALGLLACGTAALTQVAPLPAFAENRDSWLHQAIAIAERTNHTLPAGTRIGAYNAGVLGYFSRHTVLNLDGLANDDVVAARGRGVTDADYVRAQRIDYLVDVLDPRGGWLGSSALDRIQLVDAIPFQGPGYDGYFVARVTQRRFPDWDLQQPGVAFVPWLARDPLGAAGAGLQCFRLAPAAAGEALVFHTGGHFATLRCRVGSASGGARLQWRDGARVLAEAALGEATTVAVPIRGAVEVSAHLSGATNPTAWLTDVEFEPDPQRTPPPLGAGVAAYGRGGPGSDAPQLTATLEPHAARLRLRSGPAGAAGTLVLGTAPDSVALAPRCRALVAEVQSTLPLPTDPQGTGELRVPIPASTRGSVYCQVLFRRADGAVLATSNGVRLVLDP